MSRYYPSDKAVIAAAYEMARKSAMPEQSSEDVIIAMAMAAIEVDYGIDWVSREQSDRVVMWAAEKFAMSIREMASMA